MRSRKTQAMPARLEAGRRCFEQWRGARRGRSPIPEGLWTLAVRLAEAYGRCRTARTLRLDYNALKKRIDSTDRQDSSGQKAATPFVEVLPPQPACLPECIVELEHPHGTKIRIRLTGRQSPEIVTALSQVFIGAGT